MKFHGIDARGKIRIQRVPILPSFDATEDEGRLIYVLSDKTMYYGTNVGWESFSRNTVVEFDYSDLTAGVITITHNRGIKYLLVQVYDDNDQMVLPDGVSLIDEDSLSVDVSSFGIISSIWHIVLRS